MAWHPEKEGLLAFGTDEGKIGTVDALHSRYVSYVRHLKSFYITFSLHLSICTWRPCWSETMLCLFFKFLNFAQLLCHN